MLVAAVVQQGSCCWSAVIVMLLILESNLRCILRLVLILMVHQVEAFCGLVRALNVGVNLHSNLLAWQAFCCIKEGVPVLTKLGCVLPLNKEIGNVKGMPRAFQSFWSWGSVFSIVIVICNCQVFLVSCLCCMPLLVMHCTTSSIVTHCKGYGKVFCQKFSLNNG